MKAKFKAEQLVDKFSLNYYHHENAKQCAIKCVNEIINSNPLNGNLVYWNDVITEINNL